MKIAIIGKSGTNSLPWTTEFLRAGWCVRTLCRDISINSLQDNHEYTYFDFDNYKTYHDALKDIDVLALSSPPDPSQPEREKHLINIAKISGIKRIIKLSVMGAEMPNPISPFARWARASENHLKKCGIPFIILRANFFMQNLLAQKSSIQAGTYSEPLTHIAISFLDVRDIAAIAVTVASGKYDGLTFNLTGPEALTGDQIAKILSNITCKTVKFKSPDLKEFGKLLLANDIPGWQAGGLVELYQNFQKKKNMNLSAVDPDAEQLLGRKPRDFASFVKYFF